MKLVYGHGVNDSSIKQQHFVDGKLVGLCPAYRDWKDMLKRCYSAKYHALQPTYIGKTVCDEWKLFSNFKLWHDNNYVIGYALDKDLLFVGNSVYSPDTCLFVPRWLNNFTTERKAKRGGTPIGVCEYKISGKYGAFIHVEGKNVYLGQYETADEAHLAWLNAKLELVKSLKLKLDLIDSRLYDCLVKKYENYKGDY